MSDTKDGGPAFPRPRTEGAGAQEGMSLRDYFAGQALAGFALHGGHTAKLSAELAYGYADAMLAARTEASKEGGG